MVWENRELSQSKHWPSFLLRTLQCGAESILFGFFQPVDKLLNDRCSVGSPGSPGALITILRYAGRVCVLCKQREVIQTAVNFIKKPHFQVPEQAFLLMSRLSLSFIFASILVNLARMSGAQLTFGLVFWLELQNEFTFRAH